MDIDSALSLALTPCLFISPDQVIPDCGPTDSWRGSGCQLWSGTIQVRQDCRHDEGDALKCAAQDRQISTSAGDPREPDESVGVIVSSAISTTNSNFIFITLAWFPPI